MRLLLSADGIVSLGASFWATAAGYLGNNILPLRGGELIRAVLVTTKSELKYPYVLVTVFLERLVDALALVLTSGIAIALLPNHPAWFPRALAGAAAMMMSAVAAIIAFPALEKPALGVLSARRSSQTQQALVNAAGQCFGAVQECARHRTTDPFSPFDSPSLGD